MRHGSTLVQSVQILDQAPSATARHQDEPDVTCGGHGAALSQAHFDEALSGGEVDGGFQGGALEVLHQAPLATALHPGELDVECGGGDVGQNHVCLVQDLHFDQALLGGEVDLDFGRGSVCEAKESGIDWDALVFASDGADANVSSAKDGTASDLDANASVP
jgi:hypothetical protein